MRVARAICALAGLVRMKIIFLLREALRWISVHVTGVMFHPKKTVVEHVSCWPVQSWIHLGNFCHYRLFMRQTCKCWTNYALCLSPQERLLCQAGLQQRVQWSVRDSMQWWIQADGIQHPSLPGERHLVRGRNFVPDAELRARSRSQERTSRMHFRGFRNRQRMQLHLRPRVLARRLQETSLPSYWTMGRPSCLLQT